MWTVAASNNTLGHSKLMLISGPTLPIATDASDYKTMLINPL